MLTVSLFWWSDFDRDRHRTLYRALNGDLRVQNVGSCGRMFRVLSVSTLVIKPWLSVELIGTGNLVVPRHCGRHAVCFWPCGSFCSVATPDSSCHLWHHHWSLLDPFFRWQFARKHSWKQRVQMENLKGRQMLLFSSGILKVIEPCALLLPHIFKYTKTYCRGIQLFNRNH